VSKEVQVVVVRKGEEQTVPVTLGRREDGEKMLQGKNGAEDEETAVAETETVLGMTVAELDDAGRASFQISPDVSGVLVTQVEAGSSAEERCITAGDVITEIAQESVSTPKEVTDRIAALKQQGRRNAQIG